MFYPNGSKQRGCLLLPFAAQVIEIFISAGRTAGCYFCFIQIVSSIDSRGPRREGEVLQPHLSHSLTSDICFSTNGKRCTSAVGVLPYYWQKQTVIENPTCALLSWESLEQGSEKMLWAALSAAVFFTMGALIWIWWNGIAPSFPQLTEHILCLKFMETGGTFVHINAKNWAYAIRDPHVASHMSAVQTFPWNLWAKELTVSQALFWTATAEMRIFSTMCCHLCLSNALFLRAFSQVLIPTYALLLGGSDETLWLFPGTSSLLLNCKRLLFNVF